MYHMPTELAPKIFKLVSPGARQQVEQQLQSALKTPHEEDIIYTPCINQHYPKLLRRHAASLFCTAGFMRCEDYPTCQDDLIDIHGILDDAPLTVMLGGIAWFSASLWWGRFLNDSDNEHHEEWHDWFLRNLEDFLEIFTEYPLPKPPAQGSAFCIELCFDCPKGFGEEPKRILKIFTAVAIFLRNKNVSLQYCCRRCQTLYTRFSSDATLSTIINESSVNTHPSGIPSRSTSPEFY